VAMLHEQVVLQLSSIDRADYPWLKWCTLSASLRLCSGLLHFLLPSSGNCVAFPYAITAFQNNFYTGMSHMWTEHLSWKTWLKMWMFIML